MEHLAATFRQHAEDCRTLVRDHKRDMYADPCQLATAYQKRLEAMVEDLDRAVADEAAREAEGGS